MRFKIQLFAGIALICSLCRPGLGQLGCSSFNTCSSCIVVKNDALRDCLTDGNEVLFGIEPYFNSADEANVWLTTPCTGFIVAIHIFWHSPSGLTIPLLGQSISIYDNSGIYPLRSGNLLINSDGANTPARFSDPQMLDGGINEFAFLGQSSTVPLRVPVTQGQTFVVSYDFANNICSDTCTPSCFDPLAVCSGPTIGIDLDGCQSGRNGVNGIDPCLFNMSGDFIIRAIVECAVADGACCLPDASCQIMSPSDCTINLGIFQGPSTICSEVVCTELVGSCCTGSSCINVTQNDCTNLSGTWLGSQADCNVGDPCNLNVFGACCFTGGGCFDLTSTNCSAAGGSWKGAGTDCTIENICIPKGACCFVTGFCLNDTTEAFCTQTPTNVWLADTICAGDGTPDSACLPPCPADCAAVKDGFVTVTDLLAMLAEWGSPGDCDIAPPGGDGTVNVTDLLAMLAAWGPCP